jgi:glutathione S-transferase
MAGYDFSLADIAAVVNVHRYMLLELNIKAHAALLDWYQRLSERGSFKRWITAY